MTNKFLNLTMDPILSTYQRVIATIPNFAAAFFLLLLGMFAARALRSIVEGILSRARLDEYTSKVGINEVLARLGLGKSPAFGMAFLIYWFVLFVFIVSAANAVQLTALSDLLERFMLFLPRLLAAILILFGGLLFARFLSEVAASAAAANSVRGGKGLSRALYLSVIIIASITAMQQLGLEMSFIISTVQIIMASAGLAAALAFGLGAKDIAGEMVREAIKRTD